MKRLSLFIIAIAISISGFAQGHYYRLVCNSYDAAVVAEGMIVGALQGHNYSASILAVQGGTEGDDAYILEIWY